MPFLSSLPTVDPQSVVDGAKLWSGPGYIDGLQMQWVSATAVTVSSGRAYIPSLDYYLDAPNAIALTGLVLTASTFYHLYLYNNAGTPAIECVTTAPAAPYSGTARAKTGDTSRRYIGSVLTDGSGNVINFLQVAQHVQLRVAPRVLSAGTATTTTTVSLSAVVPPTCRIAQVRLMNTATAGSIRTKTSDDGLVAPSGLVTISPAKDAFLDHPLDPSQALEYLYYDTAPTGGSAYIDVYGYIYER